MTDTPNVGLPLVPEGTLDPAAGLNLSLIVADALIQTCVIRMDLSAPPGGESDGDMFIVDPPGTGAWAGQDNNLARYVAEGAFYQFFAAGERVKLILNQDDGGLYAWDFNSPGDWVPAIAGATTGLALAEEDSPELEISPATRLIVGDGLTLTEDTSGVGRIDADIFPRVVTESGTAREAVAADRGTYVRFTNASAKTYTFDDANGYTKGHEFHGRNVGAADLEIVGTTGMIINPPAGGSTLIPQDGTFTVKIVSDAGDEADLFGVTVEQT